MFQLFSNDKTSLFKGKRKGKWRLLVRNQPENEKLLPTLLGHPSEAILTSRREKEGVAFVDDCRSGVYTVGVFVGVLNTVFLKKALFV